MLLDKTGKSNWNSVAGIPLCKQLTQADSAMYQKLTHRSGFSESGNGRSIPLPTCTAPTDTTSMMAEKLYFSASGDLETPTPEQIIIALSNYVFSMANRITNLEAITRTIVDKIDQLNNVVNEIFNSSRSNFNLIKENVSFKFSS